MSLKCFPPEEKKPGKEKRSADVLSEKKPKFYMTGSESDSEWGDDEYFQTKDIVKENNFLTVADRLTKMTLHKNLILLGRISEVKTHNLIVSLPGGFVGYVEDTDVSESYNRMLQTIHEEGGSNQFKFLPDVFKPGDYVTCSIRTICKSSENWICFLVLAPDLINEKRSNYLVKGSKIICSVESIEDNGYVVDTGILNVIAFLRNENVEKGKQYSLNSQLLCTIKKIETTSRKTILQLSTKKKKIDSVDDHDEVSLEVLTPGTKFSLRITKVICNGLQVFIGKSNHGYVHRTYLKHPLSTYKPNKNVTVTLLYTQRNLAFFSELDDTSEKEKLHVGAIIEEAKVLYREANGAILQLSESGLRGYIAFRRTSVPFKKITTVFKTGSIHKCRILHYNWIDHLYVCTMDEEILKEKYLSLSDINIGDIVNVIITEVDVTNTLTASVKIGRLSGSVSQNHISDNGSQILCRLKVGSNVVARVLNKKPLELTMKKSLIKSNLPVLQDFSEAKCGLRYHGTVSLINKNGILVRFYGKSVKGWVPHTTLNSDTRDMNWNFSVGQTVKVCVTSVEEEKKRMKLKIVTEDEEQSINFSIGETVKGIVTESSVKGVYLKIQEEDSENFVTGFLPAGHMSPCMDIGNSLASKCPLGHVMSAFVFSTKPTLILSRTFVSEEKKRNFDSLKVGDCILGTLREFSFDGMKLLLPIENYSKLTYVPYRDMLCLHDAHTFQMLFGKITSINKREKELTLVTSLKTVWDTLSGYESKLMMAVDVLSMYLLKHSELEEMTFYKDNPISSVSLGQKVIAIVEKVYDPVGYAVRLINNQLKGIVRYPHCVNELKVGDQVLGIVMWKGYFNESAYVELSLLPRIVNSISSKQHLLPELPITIVLKAKILMVNSWFVLILVKRNGKGYLATMPVRRHLNDTDPDLTPYKPHAKIRVYVLFNRGESADIPICMLTSTFDNLSDVESLSEDELPTENKQLKRKRISESHDSDLANPSKKASKEVRKKTLEEENGKEIEEVIRRVKESRSVDSKIESVDIEGIEERRLPECGFSWDDEEKLATSSETSSDDEEESQEEFEQKKKKKKIELNATERRKQKRQEECEIRQEEEVLASNETVISSDEFEKLVFSSPNSSLVWLNYMAYHLQNTEIEKARAVLKRAISTINYKEEAELLNIWLASLNLESEYGTAESLNNVFQEAVKANNTYRIYLHMLTVHAEADRKFEFVKWVDKMVRKFKQNSQAWVDCASELLTYGDEGMKEKSRQLMQRALQSLPASQHVDLLVRFANLESRMGDEKRAHTLFENILRSYPKRTDVWSTYVDCFIRSKNIDLARKVWERACAQELGPKKMKSLFAQFIKFEEKYGSSETVKRARKMIGDYVAKYNMFQL